MKQRGRHPQDAQQFDPQYHPALRQASFDLSWLLGRGYPLTAALKLVGDRFQLLQRQRLAVGRAAASPQQVADRHARCLSVDQLAGQIIAIDTFNLLLTLETWIGGGVILRCCDRTLRDMASVHGTYRRVEATWEILRAVTSWLHFAEVAEVQWLIDQPVSNSGRLKQMLLQAYQELPTAVSSVELVPDPDRILSTSSAVVISGDHVILDRCQRWWNAAAFFCGLDSANAQPALPVLQDHHHPMVIDFLKDHQPC